MICAIESLLETEHDDFIPGLFDFCVGPTNNAVALYLHLTEQQITLYRPNYS